MDSTAYKFRLKSMGAIDDCEIELKPLTIFCGQNNTGKTWAMYSMYHFFQSSPVIHTGLSSKLSEQILEDGIVEFNIEEWIRKDSQSILNKVNKEISSGLGDAFSDRSGAFDNAKIEWITDAEQLIKVIKSRKESHELVLGRDKTAIKFDKELNSSIVKISLFDEKFPDLEPFISRVLVNFLTGVVSGRSAFLIPAERNGLHLFYKELTSKRAALLHHASQEKIDLRKLLQDVLSSRYAKPIADYIDWLNEIPDYIKKPKSEFHALAEWVKRKLINGKYEINNKGEVAFKPKKRYKGKETKKIDLHLTSSTVKSLFGIWFYLEYIAKEGDVLMIDEPELNLHPENQRQFARVIARLIGSGIRVVISTHSDYLVREINTLVMLSNVETRQKSLMKELGVTQEDLIKADAVTAYNFNSSGANKMKIGKNTGIEATTFDEVILKINEEYTKVYMELSED